MIVSRGVFTLLSSLFLTSSFTYFSAAIDMPRKFAPLVWRPMNECLGSMSVPSENQLFERLEFNLDYYKVNYFVAYALSFLFVCVVRPLFFFVALPLVVAMGFYLCAVRDAPIIVAGAPLTNRQVSSAYLSLSAVILIVFGNLPLLLCILSVTLCVIVHAIARERGLLRKAKIAVNKYLPTTKLDKAYAFIITSLDHAFVREPTAHSPYKAVGSRTGYDASPEADEEGRLRDLLPEGEEKPEFRNESSDDMNETAGYGVVRRGSLGERGSVYMAPPSTHAQSNHVFPQHNASFPPTSHGNLPVAAPTVAAGSPVPFLGGNVPSMLSPQASRYAMPTTNSTLNAGNGAPMQAPGMGFNRYMNAPSVSSTASSLPGQPNSPILAPTPPTNRMGASYPSYSVPSQASSLTSPMAPTSNGSLYQQQSGSMYGPTRGFNAYMNAPPTETKYDANFLQNMKDKYKR